MNRLEGSLGNFWRYCCPRIFDYKLALLLPQGSLTIGATVTFRCCCYLSPHPLLLFFPSLCAALSVIRTMSSSTIMARLKTASHRCHQYTAMRPLLSGGNMTTASLSSRATATTLTVESGASVYFARVGKSSGPGHENYLLDWSKTSSRVLSYWLWLGCGSGDHPMPTRQSQSLGKLNCCQTLAVVP